MRPIHPIRAGPSPVAAERLDSWKEIAAYLGRDVRTVQRWERDLGLPVQKLPGGPKAGVFALRVDLDAWRQSRLETPPESLPPRSRERFWKRPLVWACCLPVLAAAGLLWRWVAAPLELPGIRTTPLTQLPGVVGGVALSPDGNRVAFTWNGEKQDNYDIYLQEIGSGPPRRLTSSPAVDYGPAFSPDGKWIAFLRYPIVWEGRPREVIFVMPLLGGSERLIAAAWVPNLTRSLAWSPDGRSLIVSASPSEDEPYALMAFPLGPGEPRRLTKVPPETAVADTSPVVSPDGTRLAFLRNWSWGVRCCAAFPDGDVFVQTISADLSNSGEPKQVTREKCCVSDLAWLPNGNDLVYTVKRQAERRVMRTSISSPSRATPVPSLGPVGLEIVASTHSNRLAYSLSELYAEIWALEFGSGATAPVRLVSAGRGDLDARFSPDGRKIAFLSARTGAWSLWVADSDGANSAELATMPGGVSAPRWSPDGTEIVFSGRSDGNEDIYLIRAQGGKPVRLTSHPSRDLNPAWSADGNWIYFASYRAGREQIFRMPARRAPGSPEQATMVTKAGGHLALESPDGRFLYFVRGLSHCPLWRMPPAGGEERQITPPIADAHGFEVSADGVWFQKTMPRYFGFTLSRYRSDTESVEDLTEFPMPVDMGFTISPPGPRRRILFSMAAARNGDIWLVDNFR